MKRMNGRMNASWMKSCGEVRSHTRYHFVKGTCPGTADPEGDKEGTPELAESTIEAGAGSGAPAKSAKSAKEGVSN